MQGLGLRVFRVRGLGSSCFGASMSSQESITMHFPLEFSVDLKLMVEG